MKYDKKQNKRQHDSRGSSSTRSSAHGRDEEDKKRNKKEAIEEISLPSIAVLPTSPPRKI